MRLDLRLGVTGRSAALVILFAGLSIVPLWSAAYLPIQDLPQHLAAIRIVSDFHHPGFGFDKFFELQLSQTQYLGYYLVVGALSKVFALKTANLIVFSLSIFFTPVALSAALQACGKDGKIAIAFIPFSYHALVILGLFNFIAALPLMLWGMALACRQALEPKMQRAILLGVVAALTFFMHVLPFVLLVAACGLVFIDINYRRFLKNMAALLPALMIAILWTFLTRAGGDTRAALSINLNPPFRAIAQQIPFWLSDYFFPLRITFALLGVLFILSLFSRTRDLMVLRQRALGMRIALLGVACALAVFVLPDEHEWIWPIAPRFIILSIIFLLFAMTSLEGLVRRALWLGVCAVSVLAIVHVKQAFESFARDEVRDFDKIVNAIPARQRLVGLMFERGSRYVAFSPFLHFAAYYMEAKGGAATFSFADFPMSPYRFRDDDRPPRLTRRWEWMPERVDPNAELGWYDYVITRGGPGLIATQEGFEPVLQVDMWRVWKRRSR